MKDLFKMRAEDDNMDFDELDERLSEEFRKLSKEEKKVYETIAEKLIPDDPYELKKRYFADTSLEELNEKHGENGKYKIDEKMQVVLQDAHDWAIALKDEALLYELEESTEE